MFKKISVVLVFALLAGVVIFSACNKDDVPKDPEAAGRALAKEVCNCFKNSNDYSNYTKCLEDARAKYVNHWTNSDFQRTYQEAVVNCIYESR